MTFDDLCGDAKEVMMQMFLYGPVWDGNLASKNGRLRLFDAGLVERYKGFNWLTRTGVMMAVDADVKSWPDGRWYRKQNGL